MLNEQQAALLISLMRNSDLVVDFKVPLINEFPRLGRLAPITTVPPDAVWQITWGARNSGQVPIYPEGSQLRGRSGLALNGQSGSGQRPTFATLRLMPC